MASLRHLTAAFSFASLVHAGDLTGSISLSWNSNPESDIAGYRVRYGTATDSLTQSQTIVGNNPAANITGLETDQTYFFAVEAYSTSDLDSPLSDQVSAFIEIPTAPEISVTRLPSIALVDGQAAATPENVIVGNSGTPQTYLIRNVGTADLTGLAMTIEGSAPADFAIATELSLVSSSAINGDFESSLSGWTSSGNIRVSTYATASGSNSIAEFNYANTSPNGVISQSFATQPNTTYTLAFDMGSLAYNTDPQSLIATVTGADGGSLLSRTLTVTGSGNGSTRWTTQSFTFVANSPVSTLTFSDASATTAAVDLLLDRVKVTSPILSPASPIALLPPGASTTFTAIFKPLTAGPKSAAIRIASNDADESPFDLTFSGNALDHAANPDLPEIAIRNNDDTELTDGAATIGFGTHPLGTVTGAQTIVIRNTGQGLLKNLAVSVEGPDADFFLVDPLAVDSLGTAESITLRIVYEAGSPGIHTANLRIASNDADEGIFDIALSGTATAVPEIVVEDLSTGELFHGVSTINFINTAPGSQGSPRTFSIRNAGQADLTGISISASGIHASDFLIQNPALTVLRPAESTTFQVIFTPGAAGSRSATLHVSSDDADENPFDIAMTGNGVTFPEISIDRTNGSSLVDGIETIGFTSTRLGLTSDQEILTVRNLGTAPLIGLSVTVDGEHASDFLIEDSVSDSLSSGGSGSFRISFQPTAAGPRRASLRVTSNDEDENPFTIGLLGVGIPVPEIAVELSDEEPLESGSSMVSFEDTNTGSVTPARQLTIRNLGTAPLTNIGFSISGADASNFILESPAVGSIAPGASTSFSLFFRPGTVGASNASLLIASNDIDENPFHISLSGNGMPQPEIVIEQSNGDAILDGSGNLALGSANIGATSAATVLTVRNTGTAPLTSLAITVAGEHASNFTVTSPLVTTLSPGAATTFKVFFKPTASGTRHALLKIASNDLDENPFDIALGGMGVAVPEIQLERSTGEALTDNSSSVNFSNVNLGTSSISQTLVIRNSGSAALTNISLTVIGAHAADFIVGGPPTSTLAAGASTSFTLAFQPISAGTRAAVLRISSNDADENPFDVALLGTGIALPHLVVAAATGVPLSGNPAAAVFEDVTLGTTGVTRTLSIRNSGTADLTNILLSLDGPQSSDFILETPPTTRLAPGAETTFKITFSPLASGNRSAALHIASNDPDSNPFDLLLSGNGVAVPKLTLFRSGTPLANGENTLVFGNVDLGSVSGPQTLTIRNQGTAVLTGIAARVDGIFGGDFIVSGLTTSALDPDSSTTFQISFAPSAAGTRTSALQLSSNDAESSPFRLDLTGTGIAYPVMALENSDGSPLEAGAYPRSFDSVVVGSAGTPQTFSVRNIGTAPLSGLKISSFGSGQASFITSLPALDLLEPGASTTFTVTFKPTGGGPRSAGLRISNDYLPAAPFEILLAGDGITLPGIDLRNADGMPIAAGTTENFGTLDLISPPRSRKFIIANTGSANLTNISIARDGPAASDFSVSNLGATTLAPGAVTTFNVIFKPSAAGNRNASLVVRSNAGDQPVLIALTGKGFSAPEIQIVQSGKKLKSGDSFVNLGKAPIGSRGDSRTFTLSNIGSAPLERLSISKSSINPGDFSVSVLKTENLAAGANTTFTVTFRPTEVGIRWAAIHILSNDPDEESFDIVLTGKGINKPNSAINASGPSTHTLAAPSPALAPTTHRITRGIQVVAGRKYRILTVTKSPRQHLTARDIKVSANLLDWSSGPRHTTVLCDTAETLTVRDNTPLAPGSKRYIRLKPSSTP